VAHGERQSAVTLFLTGQPELEAAHRELYPERVEENIPLSSTRSPLATSWTSRSSRR
jgi:hypothetical protein